jgi:aldose 1-epimerase
MKSLHMAQEKFERSIDGKQVSLYSFTNSLGTKLCITNYGCRIQSLIVMDRNGNPADVVIGFDSIDGYLHATEIYHGATIGRYANRIANGKFTLKGIDFTLPINNEPNHLHGGPGGFHTKVWKVEEVNDKGIVLSYFSPDGEEGYPGNLQVQVSITLSDQNEIGICYFAETDEATILNLTNHAYFNLNGVGSGTILNHQLQIHADLYSTVNEFLIPTGSASVADTPFDFREPRRIGERINNDHVQLQYGNGYDHNYVLPGSAEDMPVIARVQADKTGITMEVLTDQPGVQFYTGNFMSGENLVKGHVPDHFRSAFCLETQHFPDSPNHAEFPSAVLEAGDEFRSKTIYRFI